MALETGLILGFAAVAYMVKELAFNFEEKKDKLHKSLLAFATFFVLGLEFTAIEVARKASYSNAEKAYVFAFLVTVLVFLGMMYKIVRQMVDDAQNQSKMRGLGD